MLGPTAAARFDEHAVVGKDGGDVFDIVFDDASFSSCWVIRLRLRYGVK